MSVSFQYNASGNGLPPVCNDSVTVSREDSFRTFTLKKRRSASRRQPWPLINYAITGLLALTLSLSHSATQAEEFSEYDLLLLDFTLNRGQLAQSVTAYTFHNTIVVSLAEAGAALEFPITVDATNGTARGWFISKERRFELDIDAGTVTIEGVTQALNSGDAIAHEHAIYVPLDVFSRWFPVDLTAQLTTMSIEVEPRESLPVQLRAKRRELAGKRFVVTPPSLPEIDMPYRLIGSHSADLSLGYHVSRDTEPTISAPRTSLNYSTLIRGDLAYMTSAIYLGGNDSESLGIARMTLSRSHPDTPQGIRLVELGDVTPSTIRGAPQNDIERGLLIKGSTYQDANLYSLDGNQTYISGDVLEGWEVELLHNGIRIDYQIIGAEGRYDFRNLPLYTGANTFELIFYGPAGEQRSEIITRYAGAESIRKGNLSYQISASQKGKTVYKSPFDFFNAANMSDRGSGRYSASMDYGLLTNLSINSSWNSVVEDGERLNYYQVGFRTAWRHLNASLDATRDPLGGTIWDGVVGIPASVRLWGFSAQLQHTRYASSALATDDTYGIQIYSRSSIVLTGLHRKISSRMSVTHDRASNRSTTNYLLDLSNKTLNTRVGNTLNYRLSKKANQADEPGLLAGNLYFSSKIDPLNIRGDISYKMQPDSELLQYQLTTDLRVAMDMSMYFNVDHTPASDLTRYTAGFNWHLKHITLTPRLSYDSNGRYTGYVLATLSLAPRPDRFGILMRGKPMANSGGVASRVFLDKDNSGTFSLGDQPIANVDVYAPQIFRHAVTDEYGTAYLSGLRANKATDVSINPDSLPDVSMHSSHAGHSVQPRPARWAVIDFPVVASGEIDGTLYQQRDNKRTPLPGTMIELRNQNDDVVDFKISSYDGFFLFDHVPFGRYTVTLAEANRDRLMKPAPSFLLNQSMPDKPGIELIVAAPQATAVSLFPARTNAAIVPAAKKLVTPPMPAQTTIAPPATRTIANPYALQLGAFRSRARAELVIEQLQQRYSKPLQGLEFKVTQANLGARGVFYRTHAVGKMDEQEATRRCQQLKQFKQHCIAVKQP